jgi:hypothetical protein
MLFDAVSPAMRAALDDALPGQTAADAQIREVLDEHGRHLFRKR